MADKETARGRRPIYTDKDKQAALDEAAGEETLPIASQVQNVEPLQPTMGKEPFKLDDYPEYQYGGGKGGGFRSLTERLTGHDFENTSWPSWKQGATKPKGEGYDPNNKEGISLETYDRQQMRKNPNYWDK